MIFPRTENKGGKMQRSKKTLINTLSSLALQIVTAICGLILPRLILSYFGSEVNGTISSITQFLSYIVLLEAGVGGVVKAALYKPLAEKDEQKLGGILNATENFFKKIGITFILYLAVIAVIFPYITHTDYDFWYSASLVVIIGVSTVAQYFFGITYQMLLNADQKVYVDNCLQIATLILNTGLSAALLALGCGVHVVKLASTAVFVLRPLLTFLYVKKKYHIDRKIPPDNAAIKQRWDGLGQHIAFIVHSNTDVAILSVFTNMLLVSVYTVHMTVIVGIKNLVNSLSGGFAPAIGDMIARGEKETLNSTINLYEFIAFFFVSVLFTITAVMIEPFVALYTSVAPDPAYYQPLFAVLMCVAEGTYVIRCVYSNVVLGAGHFRQTNVGAYIEAGLNIAVSAVLVNFFGLVGVAIGTCVAMIFRTVDYVFYLSKHIAERSPLLFFRRVLVSGVAIALGAVLSKLAMRGDVDSWSMWILYAVLTSVIVTVSVSVVNFLFYRKEFSAFLQRIRNRKKANG